MYKTRNDLPEATRTKVCELLNARLADAIDLTLATKQSHWNVKGPQFQQLHLLFDGLNTLMLTQVDDIAERLSALGGVAEGTLRAAAKRSTLKEYPTNLVTGQDHLQAMAAHLAAYGKEIRRDIETTAELKDAGTSDLFTGISRAIDQQLWFVESHINT